MKMKELEDIVVRLRVEKERNAQEWHETGISDGRDWAEAAGYADLKEWSSRAHDLLEHVPDVGCDSISYPEELEGYMEALHSGELGPGFDCGAYAQGWLKGVSQFWSRVEGQI